MPAPNARPYRPAAKTAMRISFLIQLFFGGSLVAVLSLVGLLVWQLAHPPHSSKPAARRLEPIRTAAAPSRQTVLEIAPQKEDKEEPEAEPEAGVVLSHADANARAVDPPRAPEPLSVDRIVEQRLQASEDDLRRQLDAVPELCLLDDDSVSNLRASEKASQSQARQAAQATPLSVPRFVGAPRIPYAVDRYTRRAIIREEEREIRNYNRAAAAEERRLRTAAEAAAGDQIAYNLNSKLQRTMREAAVQAGLTLRSGPNCQLAPNTAAEMAELSNDLRDMGFVTVPAAARRRGANYAASPQGRIKALQTWCDRDRLDQLSGTVPTLTQMLQIEDEETRLLLVRELTRIQRSAAAVELAKRAIVDLSPAVRQAAIAGLERRPWRQYGSVLLEGLRYPWPPVADRAAVALRTLKPQGVADSLIDLLDLPSPSQPVWDAQTNQYTLREMVRLNHLRNCLLCHAPSANVNDGLVRGLIPTPGQPMPKLYYVGKVGDFVRADITYLRQDFSVKLPVPEAAPWPKEQRFDFVTRQRLLPSDEMPEIAAAPGNYPQREAVLYALHGITGKDGGDSPTKWRDLLGIAVQSPERAKDDSFDKTRKPSKAKAEPRP